MVQQWKIDKVKDIEAKLKKYPVVGIVDYSKIPSQQLHQIKKKIKKYAITEMTKKSVMRIALENVFGKNNNLVKFLDEAHTPALLYASENPFRLYKIISQNKSETFATAGDVAPKEIVVPAGDTGIPPGPAIGDFKAIGIKAAIQGPSIHVMEDKVVAQKGDIIDEKVANILAKLNIKPIEIGLNIKAVYEKGVVYTVDVLDVNEEEYINNIITAVSKSVNLSLNSGYITELTAPMKIAEVFVKAINLGVNACIVNDKTAEHLLAKANMQLLALASSLPEDARGSIDVSAASAVSEQQSTQTEEKKEDKKEEEKEEKSEEEAAAVLGALFG